MNDNKNRKTIITKILFEVYILLLLWIILFKTSFSVSSIVGLSGERSVNLIPFYYPTEANFHLKEVIANMLIFVPLGIYLKMLDVSSKKVVLYGFILSVLLEVSQFIFKIGSSDITDIITNTVGTVLGTCGYILLEKFFKNREKIDNVLRIIALIITILFLLLIALLIISN